VHFQIAKSSFYRDLVEAMPRYRMASRKRALKLQTLFRIFEFCLWIFAAYRAKFGDRNQERELGKIRRDATRLSPTSRVLRDSSLKRNRDWIMIILGH